MLRGVEGAVAPAFFRSFGAESFGLVGGEASVLCVMNRLRREPRNARSLFILASGHEFGNIGPGARGEPPHCLAFSLFFKVFRAARFGRSGLNLGRAKSSAGPSEGSERELEKEAGKESAPAILNNEQAP